MTTLITSDVHWTSNERDRHRLALLPWLTEIVAELSVDQLIILGDLTEAKDFHSAALVSKIVNGLVRLAKVVPVLLLRGNHDAVDPSVPFFGFTDNLENVTFITQPECCSLPIAASDAACMFLPSSKDPEADWSEIEFAGYDFVFCHQTFKNAKQENGTNTPDGLAPSYFRQRGFLGQVFSGDIHTAQCFSKSGVEYVGAPYRIDFGDIYKPHVLLIDNAGTKHYMRFPCVSKHLLDVGAELAINPTTFSPGDQVKVRVTLRRAEFSLWPKLRDDIKNLAAKHQWELFGPELRMQRDDAAPLPLIVTPSRNTPAELVRVYASQQALSDDMLDIGLAILGE